WPILISEACDACNKDQNPKDVIERKPRKFNHPKIHYGNIGSGNTVMKDALVRDISRGANTIQARPAVRDIT
ncbi:hypothetical protein N0V84_008039, partial [Fusarium piperis]